MKKTKSYLVIKYFQRKYYPELEEVQAERLDTDTIIFLAKSKSWSIVDINTGRVICTARTRSDVMNKFNAIRPIVNHLRVGNDYRMRVAEFNELKKRRTNND